MLSEFYSRHHVRIAFRYLWLIFNLINFLEAQLLKSFLIGTHIWCSRCSSFLIYYSIIRPMKMSKDEQSNRNYSKGNTQKN